MTQPGKNRSRSSSSNPSSLPARPTLLASPSSATGAISVSLPAPDVAQPAASPVMPPLPFLHSSRRPSFAPPRQVQRTAIRQASPRSMRGGVRGGR